MPPLLAASYMVLTKIPAKGMRLESLGHTFKRTLIRTLVMVLFKDSVKETASRTNEILLELPCLSMRYPRAVRLRLKIDCVYL